MTARFAGAHSFDQRRRRRLAQNSNDLSDAGPDDQGGVEETSAEATPPLPDDSVIPRSHWKLTGSILAGIAAWGGILWAGMAAIPAELGLRPYVTLDGGGRLTEFFSTVSLFVAAELCLIIYWYRARSRKDFLGRYRIWAWSGFFWGTVCCLQATDLHVPLTRLLIDRYPLQIHRPELTYWLLPFGVLFLATHRILAVEMRHSRTSELGWNLMLLLGLSVLGLQLGLADRIPAEFRTMAEVALVTLWHFSIAASLLVHARYVVHVTNEVGPRKSSWPIRSYHRIRKSLTRTSTAAVVEAVASEAKSSPAKSRKAVAVAAEVVPAKEKTTPVSETKEKPAPVRTPVAASTEADLAAEAAKASKRRVLGQNVRLDSAAEVPAPHVTPSRSEGQKANSKARQEASYEDEDDEDDDGYGAMSRKERKRQKKMQRSQDRE